MTMSINNYDIQHDLNEQDKVFSKKGISSLFTGVNKEEHHNGLMGYTKIFICRHSKPIIMARKGDLCNLLGSWRMEPLSIGLVPYKKNPGTLCFLSSMQGHKKAVV